MIPQIRRPLRTPFSRSLGRILLVAIVCLSVLTTPGWSPARPVQGPVDHLEIPSGAVSDGLRPSVSSPTTIGGTVRTFVMFNHSFVGGNVPVVTPSHPSGIAYDPVEGTIWFTAQDSVGVIDPVLSLGIRWLPTGIAALNLVYDNISGVFYITNSGSANVSVYNATTFALVATVPVQNGPYGAAFDWQTNAVYVSNQANNTVSIINATTNLVVGNLTTGKSPKGVAFDPQQHEIFVANSLSQNVTLINTTARTVIGNITIKPSLPGNVLFNAWNDRIYLTGASGGVAIINPSSNMVLTTLHPGAQPTGLALDDTGRTLFSTDFPNGIVYIINTTTLSTSHVGVGTLSFPIAGAYVPTQAALFVANQNTIGVMQSNLTIVSIGTTSKTIGSVPIDSFPARTIYVPQRHALYLYDGGSGNLFEINEATGTINRTLFVGYTPGGVSPDTGLVYDPAHARLYVDYSDSSGSGVVVVDAVSYSILKTLNVGGIPTGMAYDGVDGKVFVANAGLNLVTAITTSTATVLGSVAVGIEPLELAFVPSTDTVFVTNAGSNNVSLIRGSDDTLAPTLAVGVQPGGIAFDATNGELYVADAGGGNLTVISPTINRTVNSIALPGIASGVGELYYDPWNGSIEVSVGSLTLAPGLLMIVNDTNDSFQGAFAVGFEPAGVAYDPVLGVTFVDNFLGATISVVAWSVELPLVFQSFQAVPASVGLGNSTLLVVSTSGGVPPLSYAYSNLPSGCVGANLPSISCTPTHVGPFAVGVNVSDPTGGHVSGTAAFVVTEYGFSAAVSLSVPQTTFGGSVFINATVVGGVPPYVYSYPMLPPGCTGANVPSLLCTPTALGATPVQLRVDDASGANASANATLLVVARPPPPPALVIDNFTAIPATLVLGGSLLLHVDVSGGPRAPGNGSPLVRYSFVYSGLPQGCLSANTANLTCAPTLVGLFHPVVTVTDLSGNSTNATTTVNVTAPGPGTHSTPPNEAQSPWLWIAAGILVLIAAVAVAAYLLRRRGDPAPPAEPPTPPSSEK